MSWKKQFKHSKLSWKRSLTSYSKVQPCIAAIIRNRSWQLRKGALREKEYLDIGCGPNHHEEFISLDYAWCPGTDICWDVTKGIPLQSEGVKGVFAEHSLDQLPLASAEFVLKEIRRVLKPGGTVRVVVPDGELWMTRYADIIRGHSVARLPYAELDNLDGWYSPIKSMNRLFREHGHRFVYDFDCCRQMLEKCGFLDIKKEIYRSGRDPRLLIDSEYRAAESLYIEASKA